LTFRALLSLLSLASVLCAFAARAGPPYTTDDPEPVPLPQWELYLSGTRATEGSDRSGDAPHFEANYGAAPSLQLHLIVPLGYAQPQGGTVTWGLGDLELGAKYRFVEETEGRPQIGTFPLVELPSGDASRGLGAGHVRAFLPVWVQKSFGAWTTYGGGGYWINPGAGNRDYWFAGCQVQVHATRSLSPGVEVYYQSPSTEAGRSEVHFNAGLILDLGEKSHVLLSAGRAVHGCDCTHAYAAYLLTLGSGP
jgi:Putative MetA-pathway of phenol degradation